MKKKTKTGWKYLHKMQATMSSQHFTVEMTVQRQQHKKNI